MLIPYSDFPDVLLWRINDRPAILRQHPYLKQYEEHFERNLAHQYASSHLTEQITIHQSIHCITWKQQVANRESNTTAFGLWPTPTPNQQGRARKSRWSWLDSMVADVPCREPTLSLFLHWFLGKLLLSNHMYRCLSTNSCALWYIEGVLRNKNKGNEEGEQDTNKEERILS